MQKILVPAEAEKEEGAKKLNNEVDYVGRGGKSIKLK